MTLRSRASGHLPNVPSRELELRPRTVYLFSLSFPSLDTDLLALSCLLCALLLAIFPVSLLLSIKDKSKLISDPNSDATLSLVDGARLSIRVCYPISIGTSRDCSIYGNAVGSAYIRPSIK
jgi:hypothetical protein